MTNKLPLIITGSLLLILTACNTPAAAPPTLLPTVPLAQPTATPEVCTPAQLTASAAYLTAPLHASSANVTNHQTCLAPLDIAQTHAYIQQHLTTGQLRQSDGRQLSNVIWHATWQIELGGDTLYASFPNTPASALTIGAAYADKYATALLLDLAHALDLAPPARPVRLGWGPAAADISITTTATEVCFHAANPTLAAQLHCATQQFKLHPAVWDGQCFHLPLDVHQPVRSLEFFLHTTA